MTHAFEATGEDARQAFPVRLTLDSGDGSRTVAGPTISVIRSLAAVAPGPA